MQDWIDHAEGWWNANRPRKIAMVDNPFIPRNANQALIYHNENHNHHHLSSNHSVDLIDTNEHAMPALAYNQIHYNNAQPINNYYYDNTHGTNQLPTMDASRSRNQLHHVQYNGHQHIRPNQQQDLSSQQYQQQPTRNNRYNSYNNNYNRSGRYGNNDSNGRYDNSNRNYTPNQRRSYDQPASQDQRQPNNQPRSVAFDNSQKNGQLNIQKDTKPIKTPKKQQLNAILTDKYNNKQKDLYEAIRPERPPDVSTATPYPNTKLQDNQ
ncbi:hypothetical protein G6F29_013337 [Rhizopus arrhizus]|uniref:Uncharacterized protein n=1 Tax=Rhizopus oryzae TaxID=64495 RepID=A0A9P6WWH7_RHIOR|nr:hypothetical protein G6F24_013818 [Rhizopus arrhizus]KAG0813060.1 hypothetical protein G6F19_013267 [Rhizopus arrhizus]KAG0813925.1 hypothetical protein G6F18_013257 [Rhizopus arrhizus]KAG0846657.1 hypothetical protein G6F17_013244 [Rhizopus arrhizus]KAG0859592.1 hypothetical protein G6F16_013327 [Rhizopus arrhizus]